MSIGIGIGMGISGALPSTQLVTGWFQVDGSCAFAKPSDPWTSELNNVPYKTGDYVQTKISGPYAGKRILLGAFDTKEPILSATIIDVEPGSLVYNACQV
jgi:hypothetical protein